MIFLWILTWFSYWIFMKQQINSFNLVGAGISACLLVFSHFFPTRGGSSKGPKQFKQALPENSKEPPLKLSSLDLPSDIQEQKPYETTDPSLLQLSDQHKTEESYQQLPFELQPQEVEVVELAKEPEPAEIDKCQQTPEKSNGCPKNLDYFKQKPRPKQTPEECFTCKNLIACVCNTDN